MILDRFLIKGFLSYLYSPAMFEISLGSEFYYNRKKVVENISFVLVSLLCVTTKVNLSNDNVTNTLSLCTVYGDDIYLCYRDKASL